MLLDLEFIKPNKIKNKGINIAIEFSIFKIFIILFSLLHKFH